MYFQSLLIVQNLCQVLSYQNTIYFLELISQYVLQQMLAAGVHPYYYTNERSTLEIDFVVQKEKVYPVEVKAEENLKSKSLRSVVSADENLKGWRFSMSDFRDQDWMVNVPLYLVEEWVKKAE